jgi:XTP/dITP diphosphohydrolase
VSELLLATTNRGKQRELRRLLSGLPARLVTPDEIGLALQVPEPHDTYAENASVKARAYCAASARLTLADDSGLEVAALDWGPGVQTAHFGGPGATDPVGLLLEAVGDTDDRRARMVCCIALGIPNGAEPRVELFTGVMDGKVARRRAGGGGFGYDPIFLLAGGMTTAELPEGDKDRISHRGRAVAAALPRIIELIADADRVMPR